MESGDLVVIGHSKDQGPMTKSSALARSFLEGDAAADEDPGDHPDEWEEEHTEDEQGDQGTLQRERPWRPEKK